MTYENVQKSSCLRPCGQQRLFSCKATNRSTISERPVNSHSVLTHTIIHSNKLRAALIMMLRSEEISYVFPQECMMNHLTGFAPILELINLANLRDWILCDGPFHMNASKSKWRPKISGLSYKLLLLAANRKAASKDLKGIGGILQNQSLIYN